jgi:hypothetical protein
MNVNVIASTRDLQEMSAVQLDKLYEDLKILQVQVSDEISNRLPKLVYRSDNLNRGL